MDPLLSEYFEDDNNYQADDKYVKDIEKDLYNFNCGICYEDYNLKEDQIEVKMLSCGHTYCKECFTATFEIQVLNN